MSQQNQPQVHLNSGESGPVYYTVETLVELTGTPQDEIELYCESGLIRAVSRETAALVFDDEAVYRLRQIEFLRDRQSVSLAGIRMIFALQAELERLREETRFLRS